MGSWRLRGAVTVVALVLLAVLASAAQAAVVGPVKLAASGDRPNVLLDVAGNADVVWTGRGAQSAQLFYCRLPAGGSACAPLTQIAAPGDSLSLPIAINDGTGSLRVFSYRYGLSGPSFAQVLEFTSTDGGNTWRQRQISSAVNNAQHNPPDGCTVRTDSNGVVYVFGLGTGLNKQTGELLSRSFDGGQSFEQFRFLFPVVKPGFFDPALGRPVMDGIAGARVDLAAAPSVDIANGAPTGSDATNELLINWADGPLNSERSLVKYSTNRGDTWQGPIVASTSPDRPFYTAISISPNGTDAYLTYDAYLAPYQPTTGTPRPMQAVVKHADLLGTVPGSFTELNRGTSGDARGSSQNGLTAEFFGDYVYAIATRSYGWARLERPRNEADCPAIDVFRAGIEAGTSPARPAPNSDCPANFGNSDIYGGSYPDPTP